MSVLLSIFLLSGCGNLGTGSYNSGRSDAEKLGLQKGKDKYYAYAACVTIADNLYAGQASPNVEEYVRGCMSYVMEPEN